MDTHFNLSLRHFCGDLFIGAGLEFKGNLVMGWKIYLCSSNVLKDPFSGIELGRILGSKLTGERLARLAMSALSDRWMLVGELLITSGIIFTLLFLSSFLLNDGRGFARLSFKSHFVAHSLITGLSLSLFSEIVIKSFSCLVQSLLFFLLSDFFLCPMTRSFGIRSTIKG